MQTTSSVLMIRPDQFGFNELTAVSNAFQVKPDYLEDIQQKARDEFDTLVDVLRRNKLEVNVVNTEKDGNTPDALFPNNWVSFQGKGRVFLYPMLAENRRTERRPDILEMPFIGQRAKWVTDLSYFEHQGKFLEGTGSMVFDRDRKICYACLSDRTHPEVLDKFCELSEYRSVRFHASDEKGFPIYHTNVMMSIGDHFAVVCLESIKNPEDRAKLLTELDISGKEIIEITLQQVHEFAGNMLQLINVEADMILVMSERAYQSLSPIQIQKLERYSTLAHSPLTTIETVGGGSARCMIAEIF